MILTTHQRNELLIVLLGCPTVGVVAWSIGLRLAGGALFAIWALVVVVYLRARAAPEDAPVPASPPQRSPVATPGTGGTTLDPAAALLDALGADITGGAR